MERAGIDVCTSHSYKAIHPIFSVMIANGRIEPSNASFDRVVVAQPSIGAETQSTSDGVMSILMWAIGWSTVSIFPNINDSDFQVFMAKPVEKSN